MFPAAYVPSENTTVGGVTILNQVSDEVFVDIPIVGVDHFKTLFVSHAILRQKIAMKVVSMLETHI